MTVRSIISVPFKFAVAALASSSQQGPCCGSDVSRDGSLGVAGFATHVAPAALRGKTLQQLIESGFRGVALAVRVGGFPCRSWRIKIRRMLCRRACRSRMRPRRAEPA